MCVLGSRRTKIFAVGVMWATLAVDVLFYGAMIPLMPIYVRELNNGAVDPNASASNASKNTSEVAGAEIQSHAVDSLITGTLVALQQWTQLTSNIFVGPLVDMIGSDVPLFIGYFIVTASSVGFAFAKEYASLIIFRGLQGVGSAFINTAGVAVVADMFKEDDKERGKMIGIVMCGLSVGLIIGPPFGSFLYAVGNKATPFVLIAAMTIVLALLQLSVRTPKIKRNERRGEGMKSIFQAQLRLIKDPYVLMCALLIVLGYIGMAFVQGVLPFYLLNNLGAKSWMAGAVFLPLNIGFAVTIPILAWLSVRIGRWIITVISIFIGTAALVVYPFLHGFYELAAAGIPVGIQVAAVDAAIYPMLAYLVDTRIGNSVYGSAYALANIATCISFGVGPFVAGLALPYMGFKGVMFLCAGLTFIALLPAGFIKKVLSSPKKSDYGDDTMKRLLEGKPKSNSELLAVQDG